MGFFSAIFKKKKSSKKKESAPPPPLAEEEMPPHAVNDDIVEEHDPEYPHHVDGSVGGGSNRSSHDSRGYPYHPIDSDQFHRLTNYDNGGYRYPMDRDQYRKLSSIDVTHVRRVRLNFRNSMRDEDDAPFFGNVPGTHGSNGARSGPKRDSGFESIGSGPAELMAQNLPSHSSSYALWSPSHSQTAQYSSRYYPPEQGGHPSAFFSEEDPEGCSAM